MRETRVHRLAAAVGVVGGAVGRRRRHTLGWHAVCVIRGERRAGRQARGKWSMARAWGEGQSREKRSSSGNVGTGEK
jgi:hypothetical protein